LATESADRAATVLIVDDEPLNVDLLEQELAAAGYRTLSAASGEEGISKASKALPDLVLLDAMMADLDGYAVCERLKAGEATRAIPVIFLTALTDTFEKVRAFAAGAVDYVTKPFETEELLARVGTHIALRREIEAHRRSRSTIQYLMEEIRSDRDAMVGESPALRRVLEQIAQVAPTDSTVLIQGETGTGKELVARAIHERSPRRERALVKVNCAALPRDLVESELFGHEKGSFTGATQQRRGRFELADGGTLFLDEAGELPLESQAKLLRVLQEREFERVGGTRSLRADVRLIAATNRDLHARVAAGSFRADLYYRLNVFPIVVPPLRERRDDIPGLVRHFAARAARRLGRALEGISPAFVERASAYDWPGNIRELENALERAVALETTPTILPDSLPATIRGESHRAATAPVEALPESGFDLEAHVQEIERGYIAEALRKAGGVQVKAADLLGMSFRSFRYYVKKYNLR